MRPLKTTQPLPEWYTKDEVARIIKASNPKHLPMCLILLYTGCRLDELMYMRWADIKGQKILISKTKEGKAKFLPISDRLQVVLHG
ncbi:tyrosine-type recombinase/integrase [Nitrospira defluvii]|nr:tyrosine-type recombinase/integrase [Nitrospira defluvii]